MLTSSANHPMILNLDVLSKYDLEGMMKYHPINLTPNVLLMNNDSYVTLPEKAALRRKQVKKNFFICTINLSLKSFIQIHFFGIPIII